MAKKEFQVKSNSVPAEKGITKITVAGYKSISREQSIEIRPLTILAGANSSGKSSMMQPLLLLKQTLEASYDPGA
ncbi:MAG: AAA family ATPase, partial [Pyrinomonadaceae bacterium]